MNKGAQAVINYIDGPEVRITQSNDIFLNVEFYFSGQKYEDIEARRLFPKSGAAKYIMLMTHTGENIAVIRDIACLDEDSAAAVKHSLDEYYMIPKIKRFIKMSEKFCIWMWTVETDHGIITFEIRNHTASVKPLYDGRVLIKDANDNRYEIPDIKKLDKRSQAMLDPKL